MTIVYLDLNHWINLAKSYYDVDASWKAGLDSAMAAVSDERALFPLSWIHILELRKLKDLERKRRLARFMVELSRGHFLGAWQPILQAEARNAVIEFWELDAARAPVEYLGKGIVFAMGAEDFVPEDDSSREVLREFGQATDDPEWLLEHIVGESGTAEEQLRAGVNALGTRYARANEQGRPERRNWPRDKLRRFKAAEVLRSIVEPMMKAHSELGRDLGELTAAGQDEPLRFLSLMPSATTEMELGYQRELQFTRSVEANDLADFGHLNVAVPYADAVLTENLWKELVRRTGLDRRFETTVESQTNVLSNVLE